MAAETEAGRGDGEYRAKYYHMHEEPLLSKGILSAVRSTVPLEIKESTIGSAGSGLFAAEAVDAGTEIFRSQPLVNCRDPRLGHVCDFCFANAKTTVHRDGRFLKADEMPVTIKGCTGCMVARYCSKACQKMAWKSYHKYECKLLPKISGLTAVKLAFYRILILEKEGKLPFGQWLAIGAMKTSFESHMESGSEEDILMQAMQAGELIGGFKYDLHIAWSLMCKLLTNSMNIHPAGYETSLGCSLDVVVAMMNHDCHPNAFVFFEGNQVRVRALRAIPAGGEIFVSYMDPRLGVLRRRADLLKTQFIDCHCVRCKYDLGRIDDWLGGGNEKEHQALLTTQQRLAEVMQNACAAFHKYFANNNENIPRQFIQEVAAISKAAYPGREWSLGLDPMPLIQMAVSGMYKTHEDFPEALKHCLRGGLRCRSGPAWVDDMLAVCDVIEKLALHPVDSDVFAGPFPLTRLQLRLLFAGYLQALAVGSALTFGKDTALAAAAIKWAGVYAIVPGQPPVRHPEFGKRFYEAQAKLIDWAGVENTGFTLPTDKDMAAIEMGSLDLAPEES